MGGGRELGFPKTNSCSLREQAARTILRNVRLQGHTYVELREEGKRSIFFCTLCLAPCYSDAVLFDHLKGNLHTERLSAAKVTLLGSNPWPFNDGVLFFDNSCDNDKELGISDKNRTRLLESHENEASLAIVKYGENLNGSNNGCAGLDGDGSDKELSSDEVTTDGEKCNMVIPGVMMKDVISDLEVRITGYGQIAARFCEKDEGGKDISRIWCEWLGKEGMGDMNMCEVPKHDFAIVTFSYDYGLGRKGLIDDVKSLLTYSPLEEENIEGIGRKRKKSFSDPGDTSQSLSNQYESSGEDSPASTGSASRLLSDHYDDQLVHTSLVLSKAIRRELRRQQRVAAERMCDICQQKMLPGKDVASLLNMKTGKLACSSRNVNGAFHVFHISCLIHWVLLCEYQIHINPSTNTKVRRRSKRKNGAKCKEMGKDGGMKTARTPIDFVFCPECQGTGENIDGDELEKPTVPLSEMFRYKIKVSDAHRAWMRSPEILQNCSTGFHFPSKSQEAVQENVSALKLLQFYGAN